MAGVPVLKPREVIALALGFVEVRHPDVRATIVPDHGGRDISPIRQIAKDIGLTIDELLRRR
jgi:predicted RNA binding protein YcfA (HicA-like mRNA interferase family)